MNGRLADWPSLSDDATRVAMIAAGLDPAEDDRFYDVVVKDLLTGDVMLATSSDAGEDGGGSSRTSRLMVELSRSRRSHARPRSRRPG